MCKPTILVVDKVPSMIACRRFSLGSDNDYSSTVSSIETSSSQSFRDHPIPIFFSDAFLQRTAAVNRKKGTATNRKKRIFTGWWKIRKTPLTRRDSATQVLENESNPKRTVLRRLTM